jgi:glucose-1-phosphate cytidylyltransferase
MKVGILAGGLGTRLQEETTVKPKPMIEFGGRPMLWHIMNNYAAFEFTEFVLALGYKGHEIKDYFLNYHNRAKNLSVKLKSGEVTAYDGTSEDWTVHLLDTGSQTQTGGRTKRIAQFIGSQTFMLTYGDGIGNIDLHKLLAFHKSHGRLATLTAVRPPARFGTITCQNDVVTGFIEKHQSGEGWINGGFFVFEPQAMNYITDDSTILEQQPLEQLSGDGQLCVYKHDGFWQCMDTLRDLRYLEELWQSGSPPWLVAAGTDTVETSSSAAVSDTNATAIPQPDVIGTSA